MGRLSRRLGIDTPIIQSGMRGVAGPDLAAAVSNAGGLGVLAGLLATPDALREQIRSLRSLTVNPFGVNLWLHEELRTPVAPGDVDPATVEEVQGALNEIRSAHGLELKHGAPMPIPDLFGAAVDVLLDEQVPVFSAGLGIPEAQLVERFHEVGTAVMAMVISPDDAREAVARGVDVVVAQGSEAGGHRSVGTKPAAAVATGQGTMSLVPAVRDAVGGEVPVVAAGGIADGRGLAAAVMLGADGVLLGTRFVATAESTAHPVWKQEILASTRPTVVTDAITGYWARVLSNDLVERYRSTGAGVLPSLLQASASGDVTGYGATAGEAELLAMYGGEAAVLVHDLPTAAEVVTHLRTQAEELLGRPLVA